MMKVLVGWILFIALAFGVDRLLLWLEDRGAIYYRKKGPGGAVRSAALDLQRFVDPSAEQVIEAEQKAPVVEDEAGGPDDSEETQRQEREEMAAQYEFDGTRFTRRGSSSPIANVRGDRICEGGGSSVVANIRDTRICEGSGSRVLYNLRGDRICEQAGTATVAKMRDVNRDIEGPEDVCKAALWVLFVR